MPESTRRPYFPLSSTINGDADDQMRLLTLAAGSYDDPITATLTTHSVQSCPPYEALSYVWGLEVCKTPTRVNECSMSITESLDIALRHLRSEDQERVLWVDAICIDQSTISERNHQVQLMSKIYSCASRVVVWLGPADKASDFLMQRVSQAEDPNWGSETPYVVYYALQLIKRPWFERVWVVQEVALAQEAVIQCGKHVESLESLSDLLRSVNGYCVLHTHHSRRFVAPRNGVPTSLKDLHTDWISFLRETNPDGLSRAELEVLANDKSNIPKPVLKILFEYFLTWMYSSRLLHLQGKKHVREHFYKIMEDTLRQKATDPRDKVYGVLAISNFEKPRWGHIIPNPLRIIPDYTKTVATVFSEAMAAIIQQGFEYGYPKTLLRHKDLPQIEDLPSWVPNFAYPSISFEFEPWSLSTSSTSGSVRYLSPTSLCPRLLDIGRAVYDTHSQQFYASFSPDHRVLYTKGVIMGSVTACTYLHLEGHTTSATGDPDTLAALRLAFLRQVRDFQTTHSVPRDLVLHAILGHANSFGYVYRVLEEGVFDEVYDVNDGDLSPLYRNGEEYERFWETMSTVALKRTLYITDTGHAGLTMGDVREGDVLVGLFGIMLPFILRRRKGMKYHMLSMAYVVGHKISSEDNAEGHQVEQDSFVIV